MNKTYYDIFDISPNSSDIEINRAYRKLMLKYHPDKNGGKTASKFQHIQDIYSILSNPQTRKEYDETIKPPVNYFLNPIVESTFKEIFIKYKFTNQEIKFFFDTLNNKTEDFYGTLNQILLARLFG